MRITCPHCHKGFVASEATVAPVDCQACGKTIATFRWWVRRGGRVEMVCNAVALLKIAILAGEVREDDELSNSGGRWLQAGAIPELASMFRAQRERPVEIAPQPLSTREARPAAVLEAVPARGLEALGGEGGSEMLEARPHRRAWRGLVAVLLAAGLGAVAATWWLGRGAGPAEDKPAVAPAVAPAAIALPPQPAIPPRGEVASPVPEVMPETVATADTVAVPVPETVTVPVPAPSEPPSAPRPAAVPAAPPAAPPLAGAGVPALLESGDRQLATNPAAALSLYTRAHGLQPDSPEVLTRLGDAYLRIGNLEQSCAQYRQCLDRNPQYGPGYVGLAECLRRSGRSDDARRYFKLYLEKFPTGTRRAQAEAALLELGQ